MLRALGYQPWTVALVFLMEASFIALSGILMGGAIGFILGNRIMGKFFATVTSQALLVPWTTIAGVLLVTCTLSLLATIPPLGRPPVHFQLKPCDMNRNG